MPLVTYHLRPIQIMNKFQGSSSVLICESLRKDRRRSVQNVGMGGLIMKEDIKEDQEDVGEAKVWQCL